MKIGIQTWGSRGDIAPWIALGQGLQKAGHEVEIFYSNALSHEDFTHYSKQGMQVRSTKDFRTSQNDFCMPTVKPIFQMSSDEITAYMMDEVFEPYEPEIEKAAIYLCEHCDFIIVSPILYQTTTIAQKHNIPTLMILVDYLFAPKDNNELFDAEINKIFSPRINRYRKKHDLAAINNVRAEVFNSSILNLLVFSNLFKKENISLNNKFVITGFLNLEYNNVYDFPESLTQFLQKGLSPIFFSMGSLTYFEDSSFQILDIFIEAIKLSGCKAIIQAPWDKLSRQAPSDKNIYPIDFIPHDLILPYCTAAVHHGGAGTTHTTLAAGCPSVVVAYAWDQFDWGRELIRLGTSPGLLKRNLVDAIQLAGDLKKVMTDSEFKTKANAARLKIKREHGVRKAVKIIEEQMSKVKKTHEHINVQK